MFTSTANPNYMSRRTAAPLLWLAVAVLAAGFLCTEHRLLVSTLEEYGTTQEELEAAADGSLANKVGFSLVALVGVALLLLPAGQTFRPQGLLPVLLLFFVAWCALSVVWSIDPARTTRRLGVLLFCLLGALGLGRHLAARDLGTLALAAAGFYAAIGLAAELALGTFRPFAADYRFAGTMHPNGQGVNCALLCLAAVCHLKSGTRVRILLVALLVAGGALLLLTRSRTACAALLAGLAALTVLHAWRPSDGLVLAALTVVWVGGALVLVAPLAGVDVERQLPDLIFLGRAEHATTLSGRTELWEELAWYVKQRPLAGYGYGSFWTVEHIDEVSSELYWGISTAHSAYLEAALSVGLVGAGALALTVALGAGRAARRYRAGAEVGLTLGLLVFGLVHAVAEADFLAPSFVTFVAGCGLCQLAFFDDEAAVLPAAGASGGRADERGVR